MSSVRCTSYQVVPHRVIEITLHSIFFYAGSYSCDWTPKFLTITAYISITYFFCYYYFSYHYYLVNDTACPIAWAFLYSFLLLLLFTILQPPPCDNPVFIFSVFCRKGGQNPSRWNDWPKFPLTIYKETGTLKITADCWSSFVYDDFQSTPTRTSSACQWYGYVLRSLTCSWPVLPS